MTRMKADVGKRFLILRTLILFSFPDQTVTALRILGAGASFPYDVYTSWISAYVSLRQEHVKLNLTYASTGSGEGKARIKGESSSSTEPVDYAGSDSVLSETDYLKYPDLQMLPVMAGPIVIAFNIPDVNSLILDTSHVAAIYSGEIRTWDDPTLQLINPGVALPSEPIVVIARSDKSGTTETFTAALSSVSPSWKATYGSFSSGLDENDKPIRWNATVVTSFGRTNRGMSGMLLSQKFSVGYLSIASAVDSKLPFAALINSAGNTVKASTETVQSAMDDFTESITARMTMPLINAPGRYSYPIAATTYFIIKLTGMPNCAVATELIRYINWFLREELPRATCTSLGMVPLPPTLISVVEERVLKKMKCKNQNVYDLMLQQISEESAEPNTWIMPAAIISVILVMCVILITAKVVQPFIRRHIALIRNEWIIDSNCIVLASTGAEFVSTMSRSTRLGAQPSLSLGNSNSEGLIHGLHGKWKGHQVALRSCCITSLESVHSLKLRRYLLRIRDVVNHENVAKFYGVTAVDFTCYLVVGLCSKGSLRDLLSDCRFDLDDNFKYAVTLNIARGMGYLHSVGVLHGYLQAASCYIDGDWTVKIGFWEQQVIFSMVQGCWLDINEENAWTRAAFWHAPELLGSSSDKQLTKATDVYSFSILIQEIFSRDDPYAELRDEMTPEAVIEAIMTDALRPVFTSETPQPVQHIMQMAWSMDVKERPSFPQLEKMIKSARPQRKTVVDSILVNLENYLSELEQRLEQKVSEHQASVNNSESLLRRMMPASVASDLLNGHVVKPVRIDKLSVLVVTVSGISRLVHDLSPAEAARHVNAICGELDDVAGHCDNVLKLESLADVHILVSGLPCHSDDHAATLTTLAFEYHKVVSHALTRLTSSHMIGLRMGIHTGDGVASIIGKFSPKYCIVGQTVNLAWKLSYLCRLGKLLVSEDVWNLVVGLDKYFRFPAGSLEEVSVSPHRLFSAPFIRYKRQIRHSYTRRSPLSDDSVKRAPDAVPKHSCIKFVRFVSSKLLPFEIPDSATAFWDLIKSLGKYGKILQIFC